MNGEPVHWYTKSKGNGGDKMKKHCILWTVVITLIVSWFLFFPGFYFFHGVNKYLRMAGLLSIPVSHTKFIYGTQ